ncbi:MAG: nucleotidyltransferase family protein [Gemmataceae bacterium]
MIAGLIPAAGHSRRMGRPKLGLPVAGKTVLEHVVAALLDSGVNPVLVVLGPHVADLSDAARAAGASVLLLPWPTPDMRATIERGLEWLDETLRPNDDDDWLLSPGDHPTLEVTVVRALLAARAAHPDKTVIVPTYEGRRGHPAVVRWRLVAGLRAHPPGEGLNTYFRARATETLEWPVSSGSVVEDLDTPEDYERLLNRS